MGLAVFDGDVIATDAYLSMRGTSQPSVIIYPRTIGGILQESGVVQKNLTLHAYMVPPSNSTREDIEDYFHLLNEQIGSKEADLSVNDNVYLDANVSNIDYDRIIVDKFCRYTIDFELNNQNGDTNTIRQLSVPDLVNFSRGRKAVFTTEMEDGSSRSFTFWHNMDVVKPFNTEITVKISTNQLGVTGKVIRVGGFERIVCMCWIIGPDVHPRKNIESYFYNIINGPLGRIGTLVIDGTQTIEKCVLTEFSMDTTPQSSLRYELSFLASLQC